MSAAGSARRSEALSATARFALCLLSAAVCVAIPTAVSAQRSARIAVAQSTLGSAFARGTVVLDVPRFWDTWVHLSVDGDTNAAVYPSAVIIPAGGTESDRFVVCSSRPAQGANFHIRAIAAGLAIDAADVVRAPLAVDDNRSTMTRGSVNLNSPGLRSSTGQICLNARATTNETYTLSVSPSGSATISPTTVTVYADYQQSDPQFTVTLASGSSGTTVIATGPEVIQSATMGTPAPPPGPLKGISRVWLDPWS